MSPVPLLWIAGGAIGALLLWWFVRWAVVHNRRVDQSWAEAAERLGASFQRRAGPWYNRVRRIEAEVDGSAVVIDHYTISTGKSAQVFTRLTADVPFPAKLRLEVRPKHAWSGIADALGFQDVKTGDPDFDERFVVKANDEQMACSWLAARVRQALRNTKAYAFTIRRGKLTAQRSGLETEPEALCRAARAAVEVACSGRHLLERWEHFARVEEGVLAAGEGRPRIEIDERGAPLRIEMVKNRQGDTETRIRARLLDPKAERYELKLDQRIDDPTLTRVTPPGQALPARYVLASSEPEQTARRLTDQVRQRLAELEPEGIEADADEVRVVLSGMECDESRLRAAVQVAASLAAEPERGPYR